MVVLFAGLDINMNPVLRDIYCYNMGSATDEIDHLK